MPIAAPPIKITRTIAAPVARVFQAWIDVSLLKRWLAPHPYTVREAAADPRPGGRYRLVSSTDTDGPHIVSGEYLEIVPDQRLVQTWFYEGPHGDDETASLLTLDFRALDAHTTELTLTHSKLRDDADTSAGLTGWNLCLDKLEGLFADDAAIDE